MNDPWKKENRIRMICNTLLGLSVLAAFVAFGYLLFHYVDGYRSEKEIQEVQEYAYLDAGQKVQLQVQEAVPVKEQVIDFAKLRMHNSDTTAWLSIRETAIDYPVMYRTGEEDYYLHKDFKKQYNSHGMLFFAKDSMPVDQAAILLVYGHHMKDGTMFAGLMEYQSKSYQEKHKYIDLYTQEYNYKFEVAAVFRTDVSSDNQEGFFYNNYLMLKNKKEFWEFKAHIKENELYDTGVSFEFSDQLLLLSTCEYSSVNGRLVVVAKRIGREKVSNAS